MSGDDQRNERGPRPGFMPQKPSTEVNDELAYHLERRIQGYIARGMSPDAARKAALARFGDVDDVRETCERLLIEDRRAERRRDWLGDLRLDARFALRSAMRASLFSLLAVLTLALGIGANAAVFGVVKSVLLNALPYSESDRLVRVFAPFHNGTFPSGSLSAGTVSDIRERQHVFATSGAFQLPRDVIYNDGDVPRVLQAMFIEPSLLPTLGVSPIRGPGFRAEDGLHDTTVVTILPYATWQRLFNGDPNIVGRVVHLNGLPRTVVGVLPRSFVPPEGDPDFYLPLGMALFMRDPVSVRGSHNFHLIGRLKPGIDPATANRELVGIGKEIEQLYAKDNLGIGLSVVPIRDAMVGETRTPLLVLLASAALVLLITCANLAGALLSRTISRRKEFAVRVALGAGRGRLVRQLLTESVLLATMGGIAGLLLATVGLRLLRGLALTALPSYADLSLDVGAIAATFALALATGLAFGIGPAIAVGRADPQGTLRDETRGSSEGHKARRARGVLVAGQLALCVSLLAAAGLLARSLWQMTTTPAGFDTNGLLTFDVQLPGGRYPTDTARVLFDDRFVDRLRALPGVKSVAITSHRPTAMYSSNGFFIEGAPWGPNEPVPFITSASASDDYFRTLGVPLKAGRVFDATDRAGLPPTIIINEAMARRYWPKGNAVGARIHIGPPNPTAPWLTIVGVVGTMRNDMTRLTPEPMMFLPQRQEPYGDTFIIRTSSDVEALALTNSVRRAVRELDPTLPINRLSTMRSVVDEALASRRLPVVLMTAFGGLALLLASVGVYAMFANMAAAREREFGVRVALGSSRAAIAGLVIRQGVTWMALGLAIGTVGIIVAARFLRTQLYGVGQFDPVAIGAAVLALLLCATLALQVPVRRASCVDPSSVRRSRRVSLSEATDPSAPRTSGSPRQQSGPSSLRSSG
jgi:predicted permease